MRSAAAIEGPAMRAAAHFAFAWAFTALGCTPNPPTAPEKSASVEGKWSAIAFDDFERQKEREEYYLERPDGRIRVLLAEGVRLPPSGSQVRLLGHFVSANQFEAVQ